MLRNQRSVSFLPGLLVVVGACGPAVELDPGSGKPGDPCSGSQTRCDGKHYQVCRGGRFTDELSCLYDEVCTPDFGCSECNPRLVRTCWGDAVYECRSD